MQLEQHLRALICGDFHMAAVAPLKLHVTPPLGWVKSRTSQMILQHAAKD